MKKKYFIFSLLGLISLITNNLYAQTASQKSKMIIGQCNREAVENHEVFSASYHKFYPEYQLDTASVEKIEKLSSDLKITVVFGTWCGDSKLQVPRFMKILDALNVPKTDVKYIGVDYSKNNEDNHLDIEKVPTFIFYKNDKELGRIVEKPVQTLEKDMLEILSKN